MANPCRTAVLLAAKPLGLYLNWVAVAVGGWGVAKNADVVTKTGSFYARFKKKSGP